MKKLIISTIVVEVLSIILLPKVTIIDGIIIAQLVAVGWLVIFAIIEAFSDGRIRLPREDEKNLSKYRENLAKLEKNNPDKAKNIKFDLYVLLGEEKTKHKRISKENLPKLRALMEANPLLS